MYPLVGKNNPDSLSILGLMRINVISYALTGRCKYLIPCILRFVKTTMTPCVYSGGWEKLNPCAFSDCRSNSDFLVFSSQASESKPDSLVISGR